MTPSDDTALEALGWELLARYFADAATPDDLRGLKRWLGADMARHREIERLRALWNLAAEPARVPSSNADEVWTAIVGRLDSPAAPARARTAQVWGSGVESRGVWRWVAVAAVIIVALGTGVMVGTVRRTGRGLGPVREYATKAGERLNVTLSDGTQFALAPASRLRVPLSYGVNDREVALDGEAFFSVVHDAVRPFRVRAKNAEATDVGTAFDVRAYREDSALVVAVAHGRVALAAGADARAIGLGVGDVAVVSAAGRVTTERGAELAPYIGWTRGELVFRDTPLADVATVLERWYGIKIMIADSALGRRPIDATYAMQSMTEVLRLVTVTVGAHYARQGQTIRIAPGLDASR